MIKVIDPVCGMDIDTKTAADKCNYKNQTYHFCSHGCKQAFDKEPEKYAKAKGHGAEHFHQQ